MTSVLLFAIIAMTTALVLYSLGVWSEKRAGTLRPVHLVLFWLGLTFDTIGTEAMRRIAQSGAPMVATGFNLHGALGAAALILMAVHALWATFTYLRHNPLALRSFHRYSLAVWGLWLVPFISGLVLANLPK